MDIKSVIDIIKQEIVECKKNGDIFILPAISDVKVEETDLPNEGSDILHKGYDIYIANDDRIHIDYHSKDTSRPFQMNPDKSKISVKCSVPGFDFFDQWNEKY